MNHHISFGVLIASLSMAACGSSTAPPLGTTSAAVTAASGGAGPGGSATSGSTTGGAAQTTGTGTSGTGGGSMGSSSGGSSTGGPGFVSTLAGAGSSNDTCAAYQGDSSFSPLLLALDGAGNVYVTSDSLDEIADGGQLTNLGGFGNVAPNGLAVTAAGVTFYSETANFTNITSIFMGKSTTPVTFPGPLCADTGSDAGMAGIGSVNGIAVDSLGNVYVADAECFTVRKISPSGNISTLAGTAFAQGDKNGPGSMAEFSQLGAIAIDPSGNLYVVETDTNLVRKILPDGTTSTVGGGAIEVGGLAADANGNVYFSSDQDNTIRKMDSTGLTTIAGNGTMGYMDGTLGPKGTAEFNTPGGIAVDGSGNIYVADTANCYVRIIHQ